jgi:hypothetical protein
MLRIFVTVAALVVIRTNIIRPLPVLIVRLGPPRARLGPHGRMVGPHPGPGGPPGRQFNFRGRMFNPVHARAVRLSARLGLSALGRRAALPPIFLGQMYRYGEWAALGLSPLLVNVATGQVVDVACGVFYRAPGFRNADAQMAGTNPGHRHFCN